MKRIRFLALVAAIAFFLMLPFALRGYRGDDFQFHFTSWTGLRQDWLGGEFMPGWDGFANFTLGDPRFCFYPPLSLWMGALLSTILPLKFAPAAFVWLALVLSALCMYAASESIEGEANRSLAAILYMVSPYLLVTAITRFAVAELLVLAWLPLIVLYFLRAVANRHHLSTLLLGLLLALTWLTNLPASLVLAYVFLFAAVITAVHQRSVSPLLHYLAAESFAILAAAFYLVPAFFEKKWITTSALLHQDFRDYFIFAPISDLHRIFFKLGPWVITAVQVAIIVACIVNRGRAANSRYRLLYELAAVAVLFELPVTTIFWLYLPEFRYIQFPFRFLAIVGAALPLILIGNGIHPKLLKTGCALMAVLALLPLTAYMRIAPVASAGLPDHAAVLKQGYPGTDEYTPTGAVTYSAPIALTPVSVANDSPDMRCRVASLSSGPLQKTISVDTEGLCRVRLATYFYPYWEAEDEFGNSLKTSRDAAGLLLVDVSKGQHTVQLRFHVYSLARIVSMAVSLLSFLAFLAALWRFSRSGSLQAHSGEELQLAKVTL